MISLQTIELVCDCLMKITRSNLLNLKDDFPHYHEKESDEWVVNGYWTEGFWPGILWNLYFYSKDDFWRQRAVDYDELVARMAIDRPTHDLGFLFFYSCRYQYRDTGEKKMKEICVEAARNLLCRFNKAGKFIPARGDLNDPKWEGYAIIDTLMNLQLLFWAYRVTGEKQFYRAACQTASTIAREYIREDGSSRQVVLFSPKTGQVTGGARHQGYSDDSCWSRGQAWGIYGFCQVFEQTGENKFLQISKKMASYFVKNLPEDFIPYYDFMDPNIPSVPKDSSAACITSSALLSLSQISYSPRERMEYLDWAERILVSLIENYLTSKNVGKSPRGFIGESCFNVNKNEGVHSELIFGDYFFLEALLKYYHRIHEIV